MRNQRISVVTLSLGLQASCHQQAGQIERTSQQLESATAEKRDRISPQHCRRRKV